MRCWWIVALIGCWGGTSPPPAPPPVTPPPDLPATARVDVWRSMTEDERAVRSAADGAGRVRLVDLPDGPVVAGTPARFGFAFEAGPEGIAEGGALFFQAPPFWGWTEPQLASPERPGFTTVRTEAVGVVLEPTALPGGVVVVKVRGAPLPAGARVDLVYGEGVGALVDRYAERGEAFGFAVDGDGDGLRGWVHPMPTIDVVAGPAVGLWVTTPTTARPGEVVRVTVAALDGRGNAAAPPADPVVRLAADGPLELPAEVSLDALGRATVAGRASGAGMVTVFAEGASGLVGSGGPLVVHETAPRLIWADLQVHTGLSDGTGALDDVHAYARDVAGLDAVAITDHDHWGLRFLDRSPELWAQVVATADRWDEPGRFVAFPAYEWTSWLYGHRHVLYVGAPGPVYGSLDEATLDPSGLYAALRAHDALVFAHHSAGGPVAVDWRFAPDPHLEPVTELVSVHGSSESADTPGRIYGFVEGHSVRDALARGYRLGFVGSTDGHDGHPGLGHLQAPSGGLAAIFTEDLSRAGIAAALRARRAYATSGERLLLRTRLDGHEMGEVVRASGAPSELEVRVVAGEPVVAVDVVRDGLVVATREPGRAVVREVFALEPLTAGSWVYARVVLDGGGAAWSSPVWVDGAGPQ